MAANQEGSLLDASRTPRSSVYLHVGAQTREACTRLDAPAFSVGNHVFATHDIGRSDTPYSRALLAHELEHVQQNLESSEGGRIQRADPVKFYSPEEAEQLAKMAQGKKTDYSKEAMQKLVGTNFAGLGANQIPLLNAANAMKNLVDKGSKMGTNLADLKDAGEALEKQGRRGLDNKEMISCGKSLVEFTHSYKLMIDKMIVMSGGKLAKDKWLSVYMEKAYARPLDVGGVGGSPVDVTLTGMNIALDMLQMIDTAWSANTALQTFLKNPTEDFKSALVWAAECGSLLQAAGQVVSHIPGGIGTVLSAAFQIPSKAIAAYSNIMVEYVATIDAVSGGSSNGPKVIIPGEDEPLTGAVSSIAQGASVRKMGDIMSIIWANKEVLQQLSREDAKMFVAHKLGAMIASTGPGDQSYEMLGTKVERSTSDIPWLIKQRDYVLSIKP